MPYRAPSEEHGRVGGRYVAVVGAFMTVWPAAASAVVPLDLETGKTQAQHPT